MQIRTRQLAVISLLVLIFHLAVNAAVPPPLETPVHVIVNGNTTTLKDITIVNVGKEIPETYSGNNVKNTEGFNWYVSRHYALKTDFPEDKARSWLEMLELAYPQYVATFGHDLPDNDIKRLTVVYASSYNSIVAAWASDFGECDGFGGGGFMAEYSKIAYEYPSGGMIYHHRYIVLHECAHQFQAVLAGTCYYTPTWFIEGIAVSACTHVYDEQKKQLTIHVIDRAPIVNHFDDGINILRPLNLSFEEMLKQGVPGEYSGWLVALRFLLSTPDRALKLHVWNNELMRIRAGGEEQNKLVSQMFGSTEQMNKEWAEWFAFQSSTFHYIAWGFEQNAGWFWSRPSRGEYTRTDIMLTPNGSPKYDTWRMDYPRSLPPPEAGEIRRGVEEPSVGCMIDISKQPEKGKVGLGFGLTTSPKTQPFPENIFFTDQAGQQPGLFISTWNATNITNVIVQSTDATAGDLIATGIVSTVSQNDLSKFLNETKTNFIAEWNGWMKVEKDNSYGFSIYCDDAGWMWIDDNLVLEKTSIQDIRGSHNRIELKNGLHKFKLRLAQNTGSYSLLTETFDATNPVPGFAAVLVEEGKRLIINGKPIGMTNAIFQLTDEFRAAITGAGNKFGMNVKIGKTSLDTTLRATSGTNATQVFSASIPLTEAERQRLLSNYMSMLVRLDEGDYYQLNLGLEPFFDAGIINTNDLSQPAPANVWRFEGWMPLAGLYHAAFLLGDKTPQSLLNLKTNMLAAVEQNKETQTAAVNAYRSQITNIINDVKNCGYKTNTTVQTALNSLCGVGFDLTLLPGDDPDEFTLRSNIFGPVEDEISGTLSFSASPKAKSKLKKIKFTVPAGTTKTIDQVCRLGLERAPRIVSAKIDLTWHDQELSLSDSDDFGSTIPKWWIIGPFDNPGGTTADVKNPIESEEINLKARYDGKDGQKIHWSKVEQKKSAPLKAEYTVDLADILGSKDNASAYAFVKIHSKRKCDAILALGSDDGVVAWLNGKEIHRNLTSRGYVSCQDRIPIKLEDGNNFLLLKITQNTGPWSFSAHILESNGTHPLHDVRVDF